MLSPYVTQFLSGLVLGMFMMHFVDEIYIVPSDQAIPPPPPVPASPVSHLDARHTESESENKRLSSKVNDLTDDLRSVSRSLEICNSKSVSTGKVVGEQSSVAMLTQAQQAQFRQKRQEGIDQFNDQCMRTTKIFGDLWWARYKPVYTCADAEFIGADQKAPDGQKWVCGVRKLKSDCLVYSWGSNGDTNFERGMLAETTCTMHIFDPTLNPTLKSVMANFARQNNGRIVVHDDMGITGEEEATNNLLIEKFHIKNLPFEKSKFLRFPEILKRLGHEGRRIDILKIDIESHESMLLTEDDSLFLNVDQILLEVHLKYFKDPTYYFTKLMEKMERNHFYLFHSEPNPYCPFECHELCWIRYAPGPDGPILPAAY